MPTRQGGPKRLLEVRDLAVDFGADPAVHAVRRSSFAIDSGEILGIVGESGCGKSTIAKAILRLVPGSGRISGGSIVFDGEDLLTMSPAALRDVRGKRISMIFQDPSKSLNPVLTVGQQLAAVMTAHTIVSREEVQARSTELLGRVGIPDPGARVAQYPHELSGGMRQRVMIAMALANAPALIIADEPTTALDVTTQAQILDLLRDINRTLGTSLIFISHNLSVVAELCNRVAVLYAGRVVEEGPVDTLFADPQHPYTRALLRSIPVAGGTDRRLTPITGEPPALTGEIQGCAFAPRCPARFDRCATDPHLAPVAPGHQVECWAVQRRAQPVANVERV